MTKPNLLYITPVAPSPTGGGLAMRAYHNLLALAGKFSIYLLIVPPGLKNPILHTCLSQLCHRITCIRVGPFHDFPALVRLIATRVWAKLVPLGLTNPPELRFVSRRRIKAVAQVYRGIDFKVIHVHRLYMLPYVNLFMNQAFSGISQLDLDEIESLTRRSLSQLCLVNENKRMAHQLSYEANLYEKIERKFLTRFERIFVCSDVDRVAISTQYGCDQAEVVPNVYQVPRVTQQKPPLPPFTFLFVGYFGYYPNLDGLIFLCEQILPMIRQNADTAFLIKVVGRGIPKKLAERFSTLSEIELVGSVRSVSSFYVASHAALVPIRAGGGTRIKVLEAFAYRIPVVSTPKGVEGLAVLHEKHVLVGSTAELFALQCCRLMTNSELGEEISQSSFSLLNKDYILDVAKQVVCQK